MIFMLPSVSATFHGSPWSNFCLSNLSVLLQDELQALKNVRDPGLEEDMILMAAKMKAGMNRIKV